MATGIRVRHSEETSPDAYEVSCRVRVGDCTRPSRQQIDSVVHRREGFTPRSVSRRPKCGSPAPAKRMVENLNAVTGLGEPH